MAALYQGSAAAIERLHEVHLITGSLHPVSRPCNDYVCVFKAQGESTRSQPYQQASHKGI
eukprot:m.233565 g.233565  ORF g.233565 m.233565 type:complete len:60 (+) comp17385_c2_seq21:1390-1569(+)